MSQELKRTGTNRHRSGWPLTALGEEVEQKRRHPSFIWVDSINRQADRGIADVR